MGNPSDQSATVVLLVEDEFLIQDLLQSSLEDAGYTVVACDNGSDAFTLLNDRAPGLLGLITDVNLGAAPDGWEVARHARGLNPALPIVYVSGDSAHDFSAHGVPHSLIIHKPFVGAEVVVALATLRASGDTALPPRAPGA